MSGHCIVAGGSEKAAAWVTDLAVIAVRDVSLVAIFHFQESELVWMPNSLACDQGMVKRNEQKRYGRENVQEVSSCSHKFCSGKILHAFMLFDSTVCSCIDGWCWTVQYVHKVMVLYSAVSASFEECHKCSCDHALRPHRHHVSMH